VILNIPEEALSIKRMGVAKKASVTVDRTKRILTTTKIDENGLK
jgi:hypothetical protein